MKVFVLVGDMECDGSFLMGVYSSRELAEKAFNEYPEKVKQYLKCTIIEKEIDAVAEIQW